MEMKYKHELEQNLKEIVRYRKNTISQIVIEFSGLPRAGKSTCIDNIEIALRRFGFRVKTIHEWGEKCPTEDKYSPTFNIWTFCHSISDILEVSESTAEVVLVDRGIFDAVCWFRWMRIKERITEAEEEDLKHFLLLDRLVNKINLVFSFTVQPEIALTREKSNLIINKQGRIMNVAVLEEYRSAINEIRAENSVFRNLISVDTSYMNQYETGEYIMGEILKVFKETIVEKVGCIRPELSIKKGWMEKRKLLIDDIKQSKLQFVNRVDAENNPDLIQIVPIAVFTNTERSKAILFQKKRECIHENSLECDKNLLYIGGHINEEDIQGEDQNYLSDLMMKNTLKREIKEEFYLDVEIIGEPHVIFRTEEVLENKTHMAVCYIIDYVPLEVIMWMSNKISFTDFKVKLVDCDSLKDEAMESWSREIYRWLKFRQVFSCSGNENPEV